MNDNKCAIKNELIIWAIKPGTKLRLYITINSIYYE